MKIIVLFLSLIASYPVFSQQEDWDVYLADYNGKPGSTVLNMALKSVAPVARFPYVLVTGVTYTRCQENGFPNEGEMDQLHRVADTLDATLEASFAVKKAGSFTNNCERLEYYYLADTTGLRKKLQTVYSTYFPAYTPYINIKPDPGWTYYLEFLYPNETIRQYMANQKVLDALLKAGDKLEAPRKVDHWAYFPSEKDRDCFLSKVKSMGFFIEQASRNKASKLPYQLQFSRTDKVDLDAISEITVDLEKKAANCNGNYDGWETFVIK